MIRHCRTTAIAMVVAGLTVFGAPRPHKPSPRTSSSSIRSTPWAFPSGPNDDVPLMGQQICEMLTGGLTGNRQPGSGRPWRGEQRCRAAV